MKIFVSLFLLVSFQAYGEDQSQVFINELWSKDQSKTLLAAKTDHTYIGQQATQNFYNKFSFPNNSIIEPIIIITGLEDPIPDWYDTVLALAQKGFQSIYVIELRGQGQSQRVLDDERRLIHVNDFNNYYLDLVAAFKHIQQNNKIETPIYIISHSTGSLVLTNSWEKLKTTLPELKVKAMAYWAPLIVLNVSPLLNNFIVKPILSGIEYLYSLCCGTLVGRQYPRGNFETNRITKDPKKFKMSETIKHDYKLGSSGVTLRWGIDA
ncbi:MAG: alpha/beta hydrolase, partial [Bdellovibrionales bacterium]|nr:alpha/beta hydrolase [Bdellovibrionales bacterium]